MGKVRTSTLKIDLIIRYIVNIKLTQKFVHPIRVTEYKSEHPTFFYHFYVGKSMIFSSQSHPDPSTWRKLILPSTGGFWPIFQSALRGGKIIFFFFIGEFATKRFARSRIFRYGCLKKMLSKSKRQGREGRRASPHVWTGLKTFFKYSIIFKL